MTVSETDFERGWKVVRAVTVLDGTADPILGRAAIAPAGADVAVDDGTVEVRRAVAAGARLVRFEAPAEIVVAGGAIDDRGAPPALLEAVRVLGRLSVFTDALVMFGFAPAETEIRLELAGGGNMLCLGRGAVGAGGGGIFAGVLRFVYGISAATGLGSVSDRLLDLRLDRRALSDGSFVFSGEASSVCKACDERDRGTVPVECGMGRRLAGKNVSSGSKLPISYTNTAPTRATHSFRPFNS